MTHTAVDDSLDEEWLAAPVRRSRARLLLAGLLASSLFFLGGVLTQKHLGTAEETATGPTAALGGFDPGDLPAGGGLPIGTGDSPDAGGEADDSDAVIGTVVRIRGGTWVVQDLGGKRHQVRVTGDSDIVRETRLSPDRVSVGDSVDVSGTTTDGRLSAEQVTLR